VLVESGRRVLATFDMSLSDAAKRSLEKLGVEGRIGRPVVGCENAGVLSGEERIETRTIVCLGVSEFQERFSARAAAYDSDWPEGPVMTRSGRFASAIRDAGRSIWP
jgi:hypothetical protein